MELEMPGEHFDGKPESDRFSVPFIISTPVWGAGHLGLFLKVGLPSLLVPGNLPSLTPHRDSRYLIYTRAEDEAELRAAPTFRLLTAMIQVEVLAIEGEITEPHRTMSNCHIDSVRRADEVGGAAIFLPPDCVWSENSLASLERLARSGKSVVHMSGIRLDRDSVVPEFADRYSNDGTLLSLAPRELVSLGLRHLHPIAHTHFWKDYGGQLMPANLIWNIPDEGLLLRCFHLHPLMVKTQIPFAKFKSTIDDDLALVACPDASRDYVVTDSDEILAFEMSGLSRVVGTVCPKGSIEGVASWAEFGANARHRKLIQNTIRLKACDDSDSAWSAAQAESDNVVNSVAEFNSRSTVSLVRRSPAVFVGRVMAAALGRSHRENEGVFLVARYLGLAVIALVRFNDALYKLIFIADGVPRITHPFWLVRRAIVSALQEVILQSSHEVVVIGADANMAAQAEATHPTTAVYAFASGSNADQALEHRPGLKNADALVMIDVDWLEVQPPVREIGRRHILLRLFDDARPISGHFEEIRFFGGSGTRLIYLFWNGARRLRVRTEQTSQIARLALKAATAPLLSLIYFAVALTACALNVLGLFLDLAKGDGWAVFQRKSDSLPHRPSK